MRDIIERLREHRLDSECIDPNGYCCGSDCECQLEDIEEAAKEIERLRAALQAIAALKSNPGLIADDIADEANLIARTALGEKE